MARFMRTDLGKGHSRLSPPAVVNEPPKTVYAPISGQLTPLTGAADDHYRNRKRFLRPPQVVSAAVVPFVAAPVKVTTVAVRIPVELSRHRTMAVVRAPRVVGAGIVFREIQINLAYSVRGKPRSSLRSVIYQAVSYRPVQTNLAYSRRGLAKPRPPIAIAPVVSEAARPVQTHLAYSVRGRTMAGIRPPRFIGAGIFFRPILVHLATSARGKTKSVLKPPAVVTSFDQRVYSGPSVTLAYSVRGTTKSVLRKPVVIDLRPQAVYLAVSLAPTVKTIIRSRLFPPTVTTAVGQADTTIFVRLAPSPRGVAKPRLLPPTVVGEGVVFQPISGSLFPLGYQKIPRSFSRLRPPTVVTQVVVEAYYGPQTTIAYSARTRTLSVLRKPVVVDASRDTFFGPAVNLAYSRRLKARYGLAAPAVVFIPEPVLYPVAVTLAYQTRGEPKSVLGRPKVTGAVVYYGPQTNLAYSLRGRPKSVLRQPTVIDLTPQAKYVAVTLAPSRRGKPVYELKPPTALAEAARFYGPQTTLAYSRRGTPRSELRAPTVIDLRPQVFYLAVMLARIKPPPTFTRLAPSAVTEALPKAEREIRITLAYSRRGRPKSRLQPPTVIDLRPQTRYLTVILAYSRRGRPRSFLFEPVIPPVARPVEVTVVRLDLRRRRPLSELKAPVVVGRLLFTGPQVTLVPQKRGLAKPFLAPPTVVTQAFFARPVNINLAYSRRGTPRSFLTPPVLEPPRFFGPTVYLAEPRRPVAKYGLAAPAVVGPGIYFRGIQTHLVRITPPPVLFFLKPPTVVSTFHPPQGDVCGTDEAVDDVCGSDSPESRIVGGDTAVGNACGTDEQST